MSISDKLRILAIHGYAQSESVFKGKLGSLRKGFKKEIDFTFITAPHKVPMEINFADRGGDLDAEGYGWWFNTEDHYFRAIEPSNLCVGFEDSLTLVEKTFREKGPFDGILGFSQGAAFATILCAMQQKKLLQINFEFAIIISGFKSLCAPHAVYYDEQINIPSLHIYGLSDQVIPREVTEELCELFTNKKILTHEGGHYIPGKKEIYKEFVAEMLAKKLDLKNDEL